ncbi:MAG: hypothetical protein AYK18_06435 [Theionarchaea archaeon DG-70]|nr:MAG: hypothetical protein AYK18_06435 [Theionarchaea archaeon DG-70]
MFTSFVNDIDVWLFSKAEQYHYQKVMGEVDSKGWKKILKEIASVELTRALGSGLYKLHPTFPIFCCRYP